MAFSFSRCPNNLDPATEFRILKVLADRRKQTISRIANRLALAPDTISNYLFNGTANRFTEPNLIISGLLNFDVSGTRRLHFKMGLSFTGFLHYMHRIFHQHHDGISIDKFNIIRREYNNFSFALFEEHEILDRYFIPNSRTLGFEAGEALLQCYLPKLVDRFVTEKGGYVDSVNDELNRVRTLIVPDSKITEKKFDELTKLINDYQPAALRKLLLLIMQRKKLYLQSDQEWIPLVHWQIAQIANLERDEVSKLRFASLVLDEIGDTLLLQIGRKSESLRFPKKSLRLFNDISKIAEDRLQEFSQKHHRQRATLENIFAKNVSGPT